MARELEAARTAVNEATHALRVTWRIQAAREAMRASRDTLAQAAGEADTAARLLDETLELLRDEVPAVRAALAGTADGDDDEEDEL